MSLQSQFIFANIQFIISAFSALVFFTTGWLYIDSTKVDKKNINPFVRGIGFFLIALSSALQATASNNGIVANFMHSLNIGGLALIWVSLISEPLLKNPGANQTGSSLKSIVPFALTPLLYFTIPLTSMLMLVIGFTYLMKATIGLEKQLRPAFYAFLVLGIAEIISISFYWSDTKNVFFSRLLATYGPTWITVYLIRMFGSMLLFRWVWGYIRFRLQSQLFITVIAGSLLIFLVTTVMFTYLLLKNFEADTLSHLETDMRVLQYALEKLQETALTNTSAVATDSSLKTALVSGNLEDLAAISSAYYTSQNTDFLAVVKENGDVMTRAEDPMKINDNLGSDPVIKSALAGRSQSTIVTKFGLLSPSLLIQAATPIMNGSQIDKSVEGAVTSGYVIDNSFVDGVKQITGLDITMFAGDRRAATTLLGPDGTSRFIGTRETNQNVLDKTLSKGELFAGQIQVLNKPYYAIYTPLKTIGGKPIGMLFAGKLQSELYGTIQKSLEYTFLGSMTLIILSIVPAYYIAKHIGEQINA